MRIRPPATLAVLALAAGACTSETSPSTRPTSEVDACDSVAFQGDRDPDGASAPASVELRELEHPLLAELVVRSDEEVLPAVRLTAGGRAHEVPVPAAAREHTVLLAGMRADTTYTVQTEVFDESCALAGRLDDLRVATGSLPEHLPELSLATGEPDRMAPGLTMFNLLDLRDGFSDDGGTGSDAGELPPPAGWIFLVDDEGEVVWYHQEDHPIADTRMLGDGTILFEFNDTAARRVNLRGEVLEEWASTTITGRFARDEHGRQVVGDDPIVVDVDAMHHEQLPLPDGTRATLSTELRVLDGFDEPECGEDPDTFDGTYHLVGDIVVIFDPDTGEVLEEFNLFDHFDPRTNPGAYNLCGLPFDWVFPNWLYQDLDDRARDWTHANAVEVDEENNALLVSIRHLDAVVALRWKDDADGPAGELLWHSGPLGDLELTDGEWHRHQHAPEVQADGSVLLYDNGNDRPGRGTEDAPLYSRAVLYDIDPAAGTVTQRWEHRSQQDGELVFASFVGDADRLGNGNVLITDGGVNGLGPGDLSAQIVEVVPSPPSGGDVVFDLDVHGGTGWVVYRSARVPGVYGP